MWVEGWMKRPDLNKGSTYDGWQVLDPTPQEESEGEHARQDPTFGFSPFILLGSLFPFPPLRDLLLWSSPSHRYPQRRG